MIFIKGLLLSHLEARRLLREQVVIAGHLCGYLSSLTRLSFWLYVSIPSSLAGFKRSTEAAGVDVGGVAGYGVEDDSSLTGTRLSSPLLKWLYVKLS